KIATENPQHQGREHDRKPDRDHGLAQILPLHAAEDDDLQDDPEQRYAEKRDDEAEYPGAGPGADGVTDVAAEQIERAVRQVDVAHQAEDQGEAAGDQEVEAAERDAVEDGVEKNPLPADRLFEAGRPNGKDQPQHHRDRDQEDQRPCRMAFDESCHGFGSAVTMPSSQTPRPFRLAFSDHPNGAEKPALDCQYLFAS